MSNPYFTDEESLKRLGFYARFVDRFRQSRWHEPSDLGHTVLPEEITVAEKTLDCWFPAALTQYWLVQGAGEVRGLKENWVFKNQKDFPIPFLGIFTPTQVIKQTQKELTVKIPAWLNEHRQPLLGEDVWDYIVPFAYDADGNWHCFARQENVVDDCPVYFFNPEERSIEQVADGFEPLIHRFLEMPEPA